MKICNLDDPNFPGRAMEAIKHGETFAIEAKGFKGKMVKKILPTLNWSLEREKGKPKRIQMLLFGIYVFFTKPFAGVYFEAVKSGMKVEMEEANTSVIVVFEKISEGSRIHEGLRSILEK